MRIVVHDYAGHPFQVQLSRELARRGHEVLHLWSGSLSTTPQGSLEKTPTDPATFYAEPINLGYVIDKTNFAKVFFTDDPAHARIALDLIEAFKPDIILSANTPLKINKVFQEYCWETGAKFIFWVQDLFGEAAKRILGEKWKGMGKYVGNYMHSFEHNLLKMSHAIVVISEAFRDHLPTSDVPVHVIENWAPLTEMPMRDPVNDWSIAHGVDRTRNFVYSGTLGMKHNPELMVQLAVAAKETPDARVIVISVGKGMEYLQARKAELELNNLILLPFQPFDQVPNVMGSATALLAVLEPDAGVFSVPSKVLSYLCAGRAIVLAVPPENLASRIVDENRAGIVVPPTDIEGFVAAGMRLLNAPEEAQAMGQAARRYAEATFDVEAIADRFENVFAGAQSRR